MKKKAVAIIVMAGLIGCSGLKDIDPSVADQYDISKNAVIKPFIGEVVLSGVPVTGDETEVYVNSAGRNFFEKRSSELKTGTDIITGKEYSYNLKNGEFEGDFFEHPFYFFSLPGLTDKVTTKIAGMSEVKYLAEHRTDNPMESDRQSKFSKVFTIEDKLSRKQGDLWSGVSYFISRNESLDSTVSRFLVINDDYKIKGFVEKSGKFFLCIESKRFVFAFLIYAEKRGRGSQAYVNEGTMEMYIDLDGKRVRQIKYKGKYNNLSSGQLLDPVKLILDKKMAPVFDKSEEKALKVEKYLKELEVTSSIDEMITQEKTKRAVVLMPDIFLVLDSSDLHYLTDVALKEKVFKYSMEIPIEYEVNLLNNFVN